MFLSTLMLVILITVFSELLLEDPAGHSQGKLHRTALCIVLQMGVIQELCAEMLFKMGRYE